MIEKIIKSFENNINRLAYKCDNEVITYGELYEKANIYANYIKRQKSNNVILLFDKSIDLIIAMMACLLSKRAYIPLDINIPLNRLKKIVKQTNCNLILSNRRVDIDTKRLEDLKEFEKDKIKDINNDIAYIIFTSGSTGEPKGVPIYYDNLNNFVNWINSIEALKSYKNINVLNQANFSFDLSVADIYYALTNGHTLISIKSLDNNVFEILKEVNVGVVTPTFIKYCLLEKDFNNNNYPNIKCLYFCGEQLENKTVRKLFEAFPDLKVINAYGPTEATSAISSILITKDMLDKYDLLPVGDMDNLATIVEIVNDEIILKGSSVFRGYLNDIKGGYYKEGSINCYKTGDIGYIENNYLFCKGRIDNQIKYKGYRIELEEIEYNISNISLVKDCVVLAKYNKDNIVKSIVGYVVGDVTDNYIKEELKKVLPSYMIPNRIVIIGNIPLNSNGKKDRKALSKL